MCWGAAGHQTWRRGRRWGHSIGSGGGRRRSQPDARTVDCCSRLPGVVDGDAIPVSACSAGPVSCSPAGLSAAKCFFERLADGFGQLRALEPLSIPPLLFQLIPGRGHQRSLLVADHHCADAGGDAVARIEIEIAEPVRRLIGGGRLSRSTYHCP